MPGPWFACYACQGSEGAMVDGKWTDCPDCEGQGGWPDDAIPKAQESAAKMQVAP